MAKYFGTDGARGKANDGLTVEMAVKIGQYLGWYYSKEKGKRARILVGKDTRRSSDMFETALAAGATSAGANVFRLSACPTPSISYLVNKERYDCGVMISASHNPYYDNGIKLFNGLGHKMNPEVEIEIEKYIDGEIEIPLAHDDRIGDVVYWKEGLEIYSSNLRSTVDVDLDGMNIALDLANGSATSCAVETMSILGATVEAINNSPNGININANCGSTHPEGLQKLVKKGNFHAGFAFDGDADRLIAVNEDGELVDGDAILYICGKYLKKKDRLAKNTVVTTVMANLGLYKAFDSDKVDYEQTPVGDKNVFECMQKNGYLLGGEQSGHIIFGEHAKTGDGLLTALILLSIMAEEKKTLKELCVGLRIYPQLLINVPVQDKDKAMVDAGVLELVAQSEKELGDEGRVLVRASGTEQLVRVMVEASDDSICEQHVTKIVDYIKASNL